MAVPVYVDAGKGRTHSTYSFNGSSNEKFLVRTRLNLVLITIAPTTELN